MSISSTAHDRGLALIAKRYLAAQTVVFLLFCPYLGSLLPYTTRRIYMWQTSDVAIIVAAMVLMAMPCLIADALVRRLGWGWLRRAFNHAFVIALGAGIFATLCAVTDRGHGYRIGRSGVEMQTAWLLLFGAVGYSLASGSPRLVSWARHLCLILSPAMPIFVVHLTGLQSYPPRMDPLQAESPRVVPAALDGRPCRNSPVYLFIFDEWSYPRTFEDSRPRREFAHLSELCGQSTIFHDAQSPGERTDYSVPGILMQTGLPAVWEDGKLGFDDGGRILPPAKFESIYDVAGDTNYRSFLVHFGVPFPMFVDQRVNVCRSYHYYPAGQTILGNIGLAMLKTMGTWTDPWTAFALDKTMGQRRAEYEQALRFQRGVYSDTMQIIREQPARTFAVIHYPLPHHPFILDPDGTPRELSLTDFNKNDPSGYERNLRRLDRVVGELTQAMKEAGRFDDAMLILTSDHSWRYDPDRETTLQNEALTHVPLIIKFPGQTAGFAVNDRFETFRLGSLIRSALAQGSVPDCIRQEPQQLTDARRD